MVAYAVVLLCFRGERDGRSERLSPQLSPPSSLAACVLLFLHPTPSPHPIHPIHPTPSPGVWYERGSVLVFVETQEKCDQLFADLLKAGYPCLSLHGGKDQLDRDHTLHEFKKGIKTVLVATSVAGRGLDVPEIVVVVNYHCPNHLEDYVHRVGRTGRAGRKGWAYTFVSPQVGGVGGCCTCVGVGVGVVVEGRVDDRRCLRVRG